MGYDKYIEIAFQNRKTVDKIFFTYDISALVWVRRIFRILRRLVV